MVSHSTFCGVAFYILKEEKIMLEQNQINQIETIDTITKHPARLRSKEFLVRFTQEEFDELNYYIKKSHKSRAEFMLDLIRSDKIVFIEDLTKTWVELQKQGNNINQIAKAIHTLNIQIKENNIDEEELKEYMKSLPGKVTLMRTEYTYLSNQVRKIIERSNGNANTN